jgi:hypothetical protein
MAFDAEPNRDPRQPPDLPRRPLRRQRNSRQSRGSNDRHWPTRRRRSLATDRARTALRSPHLGPNQIVIDDLRRVIHAWRKYKSSGHRSRVYSFLQQVYETGLRWKRANRVSEYCRLALKLIEDPPPMYAEAFGVLIVCAGQTDAKARSRWSRVLRVAEAHKAKSIQEFAKRIGGLNSLAAMYNELSN